jgi:hypothetical protein
MLCIESLEERKMLASLTISTNGNQGWWSNVDWHYPENTSYLTGFYYPGGFSSTREYRSFFNFFSPLPSNAIIQDVTINIPNGDTYESYPRLSIWDVSSDPIALKSSTGQSDQFFADLGTGTKYGDLYISYNWWGYGISSASLNSAGRTAFAAKSNNYFSVGLRLEDRISNYHRTFANTGWNNAYLNVQYITPPTDILLSNSNILENAVIGTSLGTLTTLDYDGTAGTTYTIIGGSGSNVFGISSDKLITKEMLDYETQSNYSLVIRATDPSGLSIDKAFTITVTNVNESPTDITISSTTIAENVGANATVGALSTTDPDAGNTFTYTLVAGTGDTDNAAFNISGTSLRATSSFDFETKSSYAIRIRSTDQGGLSTEKTFTITVTNVNESPTDITPSSTNIAENAGTNATVGTLSTTDPDAGNTFTYTLVAGTGDTDNAAFNISGSTLRTTSSFDFETKSSYAIRVRSTDQGGLFTEKTFTITVTNVNESPTDIVLSSTNIAENAGTNATVGTLSTSDPDAGNTFTYTLVAGTGDTDNAAFNISGNTLRASGNFDFETKSSYSIRVQTTDQEGLVFSENFTIQVTNATEIVSVVVNGGDTYSNQLQRSQVTSLVVTTDLPLTNPNTAFTLTNIGLYTASESSLAASQILVTNVGNVYTLRFGSGAGVVTRQGTGSRSNSLADGNWVLKVTEATGANQFGTRAIDKFFRMFGDSDGDGDVDGTDVLALRRAQVVASYNAALDWDGNGSVAAGVDLSNFSLNQNKRRRSF